MKSPSLFLPVGLIVIVLVLCGSKCWSESKTPALSAGVEEASGCLGEVGLLRGRLRLVDRALLLGRRQRHPHRHVGEPRRDHDVAGEDTAVELVEILHAV